MYITRLQIYYNIDIYRLYQITFQHVVMEPVIIQFSSFKVIKNN